MPYDIVTEEYPDIVNDDLYPAAVRSKENEPTLARQRIECSSASTNECWPALRAAFPTMEELRYASELRLQLRDRYLHRHESPVGPWCVGID